MSDHTVVAIRINNGNGNSALDKRLSISEYNEMESALITTRNARKITQAAMASLIGVSQSALSKWERHGVPLRRVLHVELSTGIPREQLRPDLFRKDQTDAAA